MTRTARCLGRFAAGIIALALAGCVERTARIETRPPGAIVVVNDQEVGVSPVTFHFVWYGDYEITLRKAGYRTLHTHYRLTPPWYQLPPIDLVAEVLVPATIRDHHELPAFELEAAEPPLVSDVVQRAEALRSRARGPAGEAGAVPVGAPPPEERPADAPPPE